MTKAFEGVRVIDFSQVLAGPFAAGQLALLGADVIKIEQPGQGDQMRTMMANNELAALKLSPTFLGVNANKRGITINLKHPDASQIVHRLLAGADVVIDAVGRPETWKQAFYARDLAGTVVLVGVPTPEMTVEMPLIDFFSRGGSLKSSWYGDCLPERDFPMLVDLYEQGRLPLEKFVTERIGIEDVEAAFEAMHQGTVLRSVVEL